MTELKAPARIAVFVAALAVVLVGAMGIGRAVGPLDVRAATGHPGTEHGDHGAAEVGLAQEQDVYRLEVPATRLASGEQPFRFTVVGPDGPLTAYDEAHARDLHLIVVRRDLTGFQHVHPTLDASTGEWSTTLALEPGSWRVLGDFVPTGGEQIVLGADLTVEGTGTVQPLAEDVLGVSVDGYDIALGLNPVAGVETRAAVTVMRDGQEVTDLGEYLGELGHLVVLRDGDLAYAHGHPVDATGTGPVIPFDITFPSGGRYRLFLEFERDGAVHTAAFTVSVEAGDESGEEDQHDH